MRPERGPLSWAPRTPPGRKTGASLPADRAQSLHHRPHAGPRARLVASLQGLRSSRGLGGRLLRKAALAPRKGASQTPPAEHLSPHPPADQPTWQHSLKGACQAYKHESSKALLTPAEAPWGAPPGCPPPALVEAAGTRQSASLPAESAHHGLSATGGAFLAPPGLCADPACAHGRVPRSPPPSQALPGAGQRHAPSPAGRSGRTGGQRPPNAPVLSGLLPSLPVESEPGAPGGRPGSGHLAAGVFPCFCRSSSGPPNPSGGVPHSGPTVMRWATLASRGKSARSQAPEPTT